VSDVLPFEEMKLRMLNGSHSFLAYLGYLAGYQHINDCMQDENYRRAARALMLAEQAPTLNVQGVDLARYAGLLIERYSNPALKHRTWQIAMDGSQKLPQRMLDSIRWHLAHGGDFTLLAMGVAAWMRYVSGVDDQGQAIEISDPLLPVIAQTVQNSADGEERVRRCWVLRLFLVPACPGEPFRQRGGSRLFIPAAARRKSDRSGLGSGKLIYFARVPPVPAALPSRFIPERFSRQKIFPVRNNL
jgi:hypothetical protein